MLGIVSFRGWRITVSSFLLQKSMALSYTLLKVDQPAVLTRLLAFSLVNLRRAVNSPSISTVPSPSSGRNRLQIRRYK